jgi:hypothetical protein
MSSAGQANEAGSVFRRNAAVYFAVHALVGRPVAKLDATRRVLRIDFETPDPTDDIVLRLDGGARAFVSAKNHVHAGTPFKKTVAGWVAQVEAGMAPDDLLGLSFESSAAWVPDLAEGLQSLRAGQEVTRPAEIAALKKLDDEIPEGLRGEVRRRARLVQVPGSPVSGDTQTMLHVLLESVVEDGAGGLALSSLEAGLHTLAGSALGADVPALVEMLEAVGGLSVRVGGGSPAAVEAATQAALREYLDLFLVRRGRVNLPFLADDLEPVVVDGLYESLRVVDSVRADDRESEEELPRIVRRRRRVLLVGQPGSGKSVATSEIAAACADNTDAPIPVLVRLPDLLPVIRDRDLRLSDVIEAGARLGSELSRPLLMAHLMESAAHGDAMLLLDGLDECRTEAALVADQLKRLIDGLHADVGVVVATRASAEVPAERLAISRLDLRRPRDLDDTMDAVLVECARVRVEAENRAEWLAARRAWVREVRDAQAGLVEVPQLALLVVLIVAESTELNVPRERAELLHAAVVRSVERWEITRFMGPGLEWATDLTPRMLLDGFQVLGRMLDTVETTMRAEALRGLSEMLVDDRWGLPSGRAGELAEQVLRFWDEHVAVFKVDESGVMTSRSRVFTEVATAMWTKSCDAAALEEWAKRALAYKDSDGVLGLAQGLNPDLVQTLLSLGDTDPDASLAVSTVISNNTITLNETDLGRLVTQLQQHITAIDAGDAELNRRKSRSARKLPKIFEDNRRADSWPLVEELCKLPLPTPSQVQRREFISALPLPESMKLAPRAWAVLSDAAADDRALTGDERDVVQTAIDIDLPDTPPLIQNSRRSFTVPSGRRPPPGLVAVALRAVRHLDQLEDVSAERIYKISGHGSMHEHGRIEHALRQAGVDVTPWVDRKPWMDFISRMTDRDYEQQFLEDIAALHDGEGVPLLTKVDRWSLTDVADLVFAAGYSDVSTGSFDTAFVRDKRDLRTKWLECIALGYGVNLPAAAAQARYLLTQPPGQFERPHEWWTVTVRPHYPRDKVEPDCLTPEQQNNLIDALGADSDWIAWSAANLLTQTTPHWDPDAFFDEDRAQWKPNRAMLFHLVAILASPNSAALLERAASSDDPAYRQAAEMAVRANAKLDPDGTIAQRLGADEDLTVRGDLDVGDPPPLRWSCNDCATVNDIDVVDCPGCKDGTRPSRKKQPDSD